MFYGQRSIFAGHDSLQHQLHLLGIVPDALDVIPIGVWSVNFDRPDGPDHTHRIVQTDSRSRSAPMTPTAGEVMRAIAILHPERLHPQGTRHVAAAHVVDGPGE